MHGLQQCKMTMMLATTSHTTASTGGGMIDTLGCKGSAKISIWQSSATQSHTPTVLRLTECDTSNGTFTTIAAHLGGTAFTIAAGGTNAALALVPIHTFDVDLRQPRKRWLQVECTPATTLNLTTVGILEPAFEIWTGTDAQAAGNEHSVG